MGCAGSKATATEEKSSSLAKDGTLTSDYYDSKKLPMDWADLVFLVPHEWLRSEMNGLEKSLQELPDETTHEDSWKALNLAKWITNYFEHVIKLHHKNEEEIYIPFLLKNGANISSGDKIAKDHEELLKELTEVHDIAMPIVEKEGYNCSEDIAKLKERVPMFIKDMKEHFKAEETELPDVIRACGVSEEENDKTIQEIIKAGGLEGMHTELPAVIVSNEVWMKDEVYQHWLSTLPPPILKLANEIFVPNYKNIHCAMRDSPQMTTAPEMTEVPFDPSMLPPPPPTEEGEGEGEEGS